jgi:hypothetical protein
MAIAIAEEQSFSQVVWVQIFMSLSSKQKQTQGISDHLHNELLPISYQRCHAQETKETQESNENPKKRKLMYTTSIHLERNISSMLPHFSFLLRRSFESPMYHSVLEPHDFLKLSILAVICERAVDKNRSECNQRFDHEAMLLRNMDVMISWRSKTGILR